MTFEAWMTVVNRALVDRCGLESDDIPDYCYWDCWNNGMLPHEVAAEALQEAGFGLGYE